MIHRVLMIVVLLLIVAAPAMASSVYDRNSAEFRENTSQFMCLCGCGQDHFECNMEGCGLNEQFKTEILEMMNDSYDKDEIKEHYMAMYGEEILTAPEKTGFSLTAWVTPFVIIAGAGGGIVIMIRKWVQKSRLDWSDAEGDYEVEDETENDVLHSLIDEERKKYF